MSSHSHDHGAHGAHETQDFSFTNMLWVVPLSIVLLLGYVLICLLGYRGAASEEMTRKHSVLADTSLRAFHAQEAALLSSYAWQDKEAGKVRIPVTQAKELVIAEYMQAAQATQPATAKGK
jgi:hypothetical protein